MCICIYVCVNTYIYIYERICVWAGPFRVGGGQGNQERQTSRSGRRFCGECCALRVYARECMQSMKMCVYSVCICMHCTWARGHTHTRTHDVVYIAHTHTHSHTHTHAENRVRLSRHTNTRSTHAYYTQTRSLSLSLLSLSLSLSLAHARSLSLSRSLALSLSHTHVQARDIKAGTVLSCYAGKLSFSSRLSEEVHAHKQILSLFLPLSLPPPLSLSVFLPLTPPIVYTTIFLSLPCVSIKCLPSNISRRYVSRTVRTICVLLLFLHQPHPPPLHPAPAVPYIYIHACMHTYNIHTYTFQMGIAGARDCCVANVLLMCC
jgi:hypothetical protein